MTRIFISTEPTPHEQPVGFHIIDGARQCLLSAPKLTAARFRLRLTDTGQSLLILPAPSTQAVVLRRQHSSPTTFGHGLWHIDFTATQGKLHTQNTVVTLPVLPTMLSPTPPACTPATNTIATVTPNAPAPLLSLSLPDTSTPYQNPSNTPMLNIHTLYEHRWRGRNYSRDHVDTPTYLAYIGSLTPTALTLDATPSLPTTPNRRSRRHRFRSIHGLTYIGSLRPDALTPDATPSLPKSPNRRGRRHRFRSINGLTYTGSLTPDALTLDATTLLLRPICSSTPPLLRLICSSTPSLYRLHRSSTPLLLRSLRSSAPSLLRLHRSSTTLLLQPICSSTPSLLRLLRSSTPSPLRLHRSSTTLLLRSLSSSTPSLFTHFAVPRHRCCANTAAPPL